MASKLPFLMCATTVILLAGGMTRAEEPTVSVRSQILAVDGGAGVLVAGTSKGIDVYRLDEGGLPTLAGQLVLDAPVADVAMSGETVYAALGEQALVVVDVSDTAAPKEVGRTTTAGGILRLLKGGDTLYAAMGTAGLGLFDVRDPAAPVALKTIPVEGVTRDLCHGPRGIMVAAETFSWVQRPEAAFPRVDMTGVPKPAAVANVDSHFFVGVEQTLQRLDAQGMMYGGNNLYRFDGAVMDIEVFGLLTAIAVGDAGVALLHKDVLTWSKSAHIPVPGKALRVHGWDKRLFVVTEKKGLYIYDVGDPKKPTQIFPGK